MSHSIRLAALIALVAHPVCVSAKESKFLKDMKAAARAGLNPKVRGRVLLADGKVLTCFVDVKVGYLGPPDITSPAYNVSDPRSGRIVVRTAAIPTMVWLEPTHWVQNDCDLFDKMGVLKPDGVVPPPASVSVASPEAYSGKVRDAATLCKISPTLALSLRDESMQFLRIDRGRIVVSEKRLGKRSVTALDGEDFAQRATEAAAGIAARGPQCGKAFWDNDAIQAASLALQGR
jgi:hypothetical protein